MVGYNSLGFDYPIIHDLLVAPYQFDHNRAKQLCDEIIGKQQYGFTSIRFGERIIPQVDLAKINHFDNKNRRTSLKSLQFAMRSESVEDLPYDPNVPLTYEQMDHMLEYNLHDVTETEKFLQKCKHLITKRQELVETGVLGGDVLNFSDVKIGVEYLIKKIGRSRCFTNGSTAKTTPRSIIDFRDIILPKIFFKTDKFQDVLKWFNEQRIVVDSSTRPELEATLGGLQFHFGVGGVHASVENKVYHSSETHMIKDIDVSGMYVAVAISNGFAPEHLGQPFSDAYKQLQSDRKQYPKGTTMNAVLKLAGNGVYGNSNNPYSCFYDPKYTFTVTVNGQLQLLQLVEDISLIPGIELIQANTDGITVYMPRDMEIWFDAWCEQWENHSLLKLEDVEYKGMWIADVNNYVAQTMDGKVKRKGRYWYPETEDDYEGVWNKDFSSMVVQKAASQTLTKNWNPEALVKIASDPFDFMLRYKTPGTAKVYIGDKPMQKTVRYYVSLSGERMLKIAKPKGRIGDYKRKNKLTDEYFNKILTEIPPGSWDERIHTKNKSVYKEVHTTIKSGRLVKECNRADNFNWSDIDYEYYIEEIRKIIIQ